MDDREAHQEIKQLIVVTIGAIIAMIALVVSVYIFFKSSYSFDYRAVSTVNIPDYSVQLRYSRTRIRKSD